MAWSHLDITKPHLVYIILGGFTSLFMLCSSFIKERMYIGEATVATLCGVIFGPHAANLINPSEWGSVDIVTIEFSRIVLVVQCFAVGVELPRFYMEKHWNSVVYLLVPVMTAGWLIVSLFIWWMIPPFDWLDSLVVAACVTATDPVLASSVVGKGKFAKRVPKHLRDLLSAESGCNDGMAFPFIYLSLYLLQYHRSAREVSFHFVVYVVLYECIFGAVFGFLVGYIARHGIKLAEKRDLIDRESFLVFYFVVALFCAGSGSILGVDDLLVGFAAGVGFSNDGWFGEKTEESHVSNVIDLLLNLTYFVYLGTIIPWEQYNNGVEGLEVWRLIVIAILVIFFRRIPVMMMLKPFIPDIKTWREALFAGHFGPIGVGAIFVAILARAELEHEEPIPLGELPPPDHEFYNVIYLVWPIVTFLVITSIVVHGSSIAVFTLGKRINTLTLTMSYTAAPEEGPSWMNRLPRISSQSRSQAKTMSDASFDEYKDPEYPPGTLAPPSNFLRRQKDDSSRPNSRASSLVSRRRKSKKWEDGLGPGGPISQSAIFPNRQSQTLPMSPTDTEKDASRTPIEHTDSTLTESSPEKDYEKGESSESFSKEEEEEARPSRRDSSERSPHNRRQAPEVDVYEEGGNMVFETHQGDVLAVEPSPNASQEELPRPNIGRTRSKSEADRTKNWTFDGLRRKMTDVYSSEVEKRKVKADDGRKHEPARAYQFGNTIIVEDEDGEVVKTYDLPPQRAEGSTSAGERFGGGLKYIGLGGSRRAEKSPEATAEEGEAGGGSGSGQSTMQRTTSRFGWSTLAGQTPKQRAEAARRKSVAAQAAAADDKQIRFTIGGVGQRMTKEDFLYEMRKLDVGPRKEAVESSDASQALKQAAKQQPVRRNTQPIVPRIEEHSPASSVGRDSPRASASPVRGRPHGEGFATAASSSRSPPAAATVAAASSSAQPSRSSAAPQPSEQQGETAVERKRRLAVLSENGQKDSIDTGETPAERRRREAALGLGGAAAQEDSDSEDEGGERVPPARRGIRFAEPTRGGQR